MQNGSALSKQNSVGPPEMKRAVPMLKQAEKCQRQQKQHIPLYIYKILDLRITCL